MGPQSVLEEVGRCLQSSPIRQVSVPDGIRFQFSKKGVHRRHLLFDTSVQPALHTSAHLLEYTLSRIELRTVWRLYYRRHSHTLHQLAPVTTRSIPHQRSHIRLMLQPIDRRRYPLRLHRVGPGPQQLPPTTVYHQEQVHPLVHQLHSLTHLDPATTPYPTHHSPQAHSHLIGKPQDRL